VGEWGKGKSEAADQPGSAAFASCTQKLWSWSRQDIRSRRVRTRRRHIGPRPASRVCKREGEGVAPAGTAASDLDRRRSNPCFPPPSRVGSPDVRRQRKRHSWGSNDATPGRASLRQELSPRRHPPRPGTARYLRSIQRSERSAFSEEGTGPRAKTVSAARNIAGTAAICAATSRSQSKGRGDENLALDAVPPTARKRLVEFGAARRCRLIRFVGPPGVLRRESQLARS